MVVGGNVDFFDVVDKGCGQACKLFDFLMHWTVHVYSVKLFWLTVRNK